MDFFAISGLLNGIAATGLALLVFFRSPEDSRHWTYGLFGLTTAIWSFGYFAWQVSESRELALFFVRFLMAGAIFIPVTFLHHVSILTNDLNRNRLVLRSSYLVGAVFLLADLTPSFVSDVQPILFFPFWPTPGPLFHVFLFWWVGIVIYAHFLLGKAYIRETGLRRHQYLYLMVASGIGYAGGATNFPLWYGIEILPYGTICFTFYVALVAYTLLRYHLLNFSVFVEKGLSYLAVLFLISQPAYPVLLLAQKSFFGAISFRFSMVQLFVHLLTVAGAYQMKMGTRGAVARTVLSGRQHRLQTLSRFSESMVESHDLKTIGNKIVQTLVQGMGARSGFLFLLSQEKNLYVPASSYGGSLNLQALPQFAVTDYLPRYLAIVQSRIIRQDLSEVSPDKWKQAVIHDLESLGADVCLPFISKNRLLGFCTLGPTVSMAVDGSEDLGIVKTLLQEAAIALENVLLREEIKRSQALVYHIDRLRSLETMAWGLSQELHSPATSIKAFVQLAQLRKNDEEFLSQLQSVVSADIVRIEQLTKEIRDYLTPLSPNLKEEKINEVLTSCLSFISLHPEYKAIQLDTKLDPELPGVLVDRQQIRQVFFNLLLYCVKTKGENERKISVRSSTIAGSTGVPWVQVEIERTGNMVSTDQPLNFNTKIIGDSSPLHLEDVDSTDQSLAIAQQILQENQGHIRVVNVGGNSTLFTVAIPIHDYQDR